METVATISVILNFILAIGGVYALFAKPFKKYKEVLSSIVNSQLCLLRNDITEIYYKHIDEETPTLREYERKNLDDLAQGYFAQHGNHYITDIYKEMRTWKVIP